MLKLTCALATLLALCGARTNAATITTVVHRAEQVVVSIQGEIKAGDERLVADFLSILRSDGHAWVYLKSKGGDVQTSMAIGRVLRRHDAAASVQSECLSSCVLILIGAVDRYVTTSARHGWGVGIHRPYFAALPPNLSSAEITNRRDRLKDQIAGYIKEMNITSRLLDLMEAIPPEKIKMLTEAEVSDLGLDAPDPVWDEKVVADDAAFRGVSSMQFRSRRANSEVRCPMPGWKAPGKLFGERIYCIEAVLWGLSIDEFRSREAKYKEWLSESPYIDQKVYPDRASPTVVTAVRRCHTRIMTTGARTCTP